MQSFRERSVLLVDGANMYSCCRNLGIEVDYGRFAAYFAARSHLVRSYYYTAILENSEHSSVKPLVDWLDYNGYKVVTKDAKEFSTPDGGRRVKGNMDIELTVDAMSLSETIDHFYICSGDGDFVYLVNELQRRGRRVTVVSSRKTTSAILADGLRRAADGFIDLADIKDEIVRTRAA
ncbi:NYN domain-containing protein [Agrobacterium rubi]|nr:NYN domain-containing protein [Agrobacterium rubi]NTF24608.1 NYN domain-containing protein [Agrobacterium rubi]